MKIDERILSRAAELARLELSEDEKSEFARQLTDIIGYVKKIEELDTDSVELEDAVPGRVHPLRDDSLRESLPREEVGKMAPEFGDGHVVVPRILGER
ncbi:MAG: Asp-tRNA(Asn)/Glu-tRNA(Gln) amidotransferase subunit GatC [Spirochaetes bacterium]|nr:Asp-tRNA(Asn)/Glu-tRNA(Gln) amidotransferase subunit GatC [Spirochaetota bacterium]